MLPSRIQRYTSRSDTRRRLAASRTLSLIVLLQVSPRGGLTQGPYREDSLLTAYALIELERGRSYPGPAVGHWNGACRGRLPLCGVLRVGFPMQRGGPSDIVSQSSISGSVSHSVALSR